MRIIPLSEGSFTIGSDKVFHPFDTDSDELQQRAKGSLLVEVQPFCIALERDTILLDCGLGFSKSNKLQIYQNLEDNGIAPDSVTKVLMTHLHKDHAGGISVNDRFGDAKLAFPNAAFFVQRREFEFAVETGRPSFVPHELDALDNDTRVVWLHDDEGVIDNYIHYQLTGGHSPWHQVFWINAEGKKIFFGGDEAPQLNQMKSRFVAKYDYDGKKAMEWRAQWWEQGNREGWTFLFYHDVAHAVVEGNEQNAEQVQRASP